jgi:hypothetical protein
MKTATPHGFPHTEKEVPDFIGVSGEWRKFRSLVLYPAELRALLEKSPINRAFDAVAHPFFVVQRQNLNAADEPRTNAVSPPTNPHTGFGLRSTTQRTEQ